MLRVLQVLAVDQVRELEAQIDEIEEAHFKLETGGAEELLKAVFLSHGLCGSSCNAVVSGVQVVACVITEVQEEVQTRENAVHEELGTREAQVDVGNCTEICVVAVGIDSTDLAAEGNGS